MTNSPNKKKTPSTTDIADCSSDAPFDPLINDVQTHCDEKSDSHEYMSSRRHVSESSTASNYDRFNRRNEERKPIANPCMVIPVLADGFPDDCNISVGFAMDISQVGIGFEVAGDNRITTNNVIFGLEGNEGEMEFVSTFVRFSEAQYASQRLGAEFADSSQQLFAANNILPCYDRDQLKFKTGLDDDALKAWEDCGVLVRTMRDKILVCPQCQSLPTWRLGCPSCGSSSTQADQLIHHYACAHIGHVDDFEKTGELRCPKCAVKDMVVGADFEYLNGPESCDNCGWTDSKLSPIGNCLSCGFRFAGHQALEIVINGYDVRRLDPLVYLS